MCNVHAGPWMSCPQLLLHRGELYALVRNLEDAMKTVAMFLHVEESYWIMESQAGAVDSGIHGRRCLSSLETNLKVMDSDEVLFRLE